MFNAACQPIYERVPVTVQCRQQQEARLLRKKTDRVKQPSPYESIIAREVLERFDNASIILACHMNSMKAYDYFRHQVRFHENGATLKTYGSSIIRYAIRDTKYREMLRLFNSHYAIIFSSEENINKLLQILKKSPKLLLLGGILEDRFMNKNQIVDYSQLPSLDVARAQLAATLYSPGNSIVGKLQAHQSNLCSLLDMRAKELGESEQKTEETPQADVKEVSAEPPEEKK